MPTSFVKQAGKQLAPAYNTQIKAQKAQIPAIQKLYQSLFAGLESKGAQQEQGLYEDASGRGLLHSTIPVDALTGLSQALIQERGVLSGQQAGEIGKIRTGIADTRVQKANAIAQLVQALRSQALQGKQFGFQKTQAQKQLELQRQLANRQYQLDKQLLG